jgi:hypothetical protein
MLQAGTENPPHSPRPLASYSFLTEATFTPAFSAFSRIVFWAARFSSSLTGSDAARANFSHSFISSPFSIFSPPDYLLFIPDNVVRLRR